jgi:hypothetical protein
VEEHRKENSLTTGARKWKEGRLVLYSFARVSFQLICTDYNANRVRWK